MIRLRPRPRPDPAGAPPSEDRKWTGRLKKAAGFVAIALAVALTQGLGLLRPVDDALAGLRFDLLGRPASGELVVVEIDAASLRAAGRWPWGRERYARAIGELQKAGAAAVAFDVDFSARSSREADAALQQAIEAWPGGVVLPTFVQTLGRGESRSQVVQTSPLAALTGQSVLASVNVPVDVDGRVRRYNYGFGEGEAYRASVAAMLAGAAPGRTDTFMIDYGVRVRTIPHLSFQDVYAGRFDPASVKGRQILIGATALELGDEFATLRRGAMPGVYVHALAFESVRGGRALMLLSPLAVMALALGAAWVLRPREASDVNRIMRRHLAVFVGAVGGSFALQAFAPVTVDIAPILMTQALCGIWVTRVELKRRAEAIIREREAGLLHLALHEPESELPNRRALLRDLARRLETHDGKAVAVAAIGIDRFAAMRGAIGYQRFNEVVRQVAARVREAAEESMVAHLSTSVVGVVITADTGEALMAKAARLEALDPWLAIDGLSVDAFVRTGVAYCLDGADTAEALLENASIALDRAREADRRMVIYDPEVFADPSLNIALMSDMLRGLEAGEIELHYQPKMMVRTGEVLAAEALVRWTHPTRGRIPPDTLIAVAEETGMIRALTEWGVARAIADLKRLTAEGHSITLAVNISGSLMADREFRKKVLREAAGYERLLCLEITESAIIRNPGQAMAAIADYRDAGLKISIDDYGSGLSSLSYLKMIDADELKVDKSLVTALGESDRDRLILRSTVDLAHSLGMSVVAEGVETADVLGQLGEIGCDVAQGWLIAKALPLPDLITFLRVRPDGHSRGMSMAS